MSGAFQPGTHTRGRGRAGEDQAVRWLERQGYRILDRNVVNRGGEIDVVARDGDTICFVEIKARGGAAYGAALAAVTPAKQRRLARAAALHLALHGLSGACRFDVLGLDWTADGWEYSLVRDAFSVQG
ncbi:MAG TPA: YraN family protein [Thermoanaerobaculia bacterium]